jgi:hypothetical protein
MKPRTTLRSLPLARSVLTRCSSPPVALTWPVDFFESATTATELLCALATYRVRSSSPSASPSGLAPTGASSLSRTLMRSTSVSRSVSITETLSAFELTT